jgi:hypothetical protein
VNNFEDLWSVTMFSFSNEILARKNKPIEILESLVDSGLTKFVEIDGPQFFRNYPNPSAAEVGQVNELLSGRGVGVSLLGAYMDRAFGHGIMATRQQLMAQIDAQLALGAKLGAKALRIQADAIRDDELDEVLELIEKHGVPLLLELQGSGSPTSPIATHAIAQIKASGGKLGLLLDASLFMMSFPPTFLKLLTKIGVSQEQQTLLETNWKSMSSGEFRGWLISAIESGDLPGSIRSQMPTLLSRFGCGKVSDWAEHADLIHSVHLKYWDGEDGQGELSQVAKQIVELLPESFEGNICSEWGGHEWHTLEELPGLEITRQHRLAVAGALQSAN